jgi:cytochrome P450
MTESLTATTLADKIRRPSLKHFPGDTLVGAITHRVGVSPEPLADPPPGSGLEPVMGERGLPLLGKTLEILREGQAHTVEYYQKYGGVFWNSAFGTKIVWVIAPDPVQQVLTNKNKVYSQSGWEYFLGHFFTRGLMLLDGQEHLLHRRIMQEAFTRSRLAAYLSQINGIIDETIPAWPVDEPMLMFPAVKSLSLDIATRVFMGSEPSPEADRLTQAFVDTVRAGTGFVRAGRPGLPNRWSKGLTGRKVLEDYFRPLIAQKRASDAEDLFAVLTHVETEDGHRFGDDDIVNHMIFLMMAAHDTSTITASAMAYYLAKNPSWQERCRVESQSLGDLAPDLAALDTLTSLELVFREAMRLVAPVPALVRRATEDTALDGKFIPAGTMLAVVPGAVHILPERWTDAESFDPERYGAPRHEEKRHRFQDVAFGGGAHKCIGMSFGTAEVKSLLHQVLLKYRLEVPENYEVEWDHTSLVVPTDGMPITLRKIS